MIDVSAIPDGLENSIGEAKSEDVLDGLFAEVMVDPVDLFFVGNLEQLLVQRASAFEIMAEGLFYDHAAPVAVVLLHQAVFGEVLHDRSESIRSSGQVVEVVSVSRVLLVDFGEQVFEIRIGLRVVEVARHVVHAAHKPLPQIGVDVTGGKLLHVLSDFFAIVVSGHGATGDADYGEFVREQFGARKVVEGWNQLSPSQVTGSPEDDHHARVGDFSDGLSASERSGLGLGHKSFVSSRAQENDQDPVRQFSGRL